LRIVRTRRMVEMVGMCSSLGGHEPTLYPR
jgi:hypothetical protein